MHVRCLTVLLYYCCTDFYFYFYFAHSVVFFRTTLCESLAAMKILLTIEEKEEGVGEEEEGRGVQEEGKGGAESGRERMIEVNEQRDEECYVEYNEDKGYEQNNDDEEVEEIEKSDVAVRGLHPIYTDSRNRNESRSNEMPPDILLRPIGIGIGQLTHHNLRNVHAHENVHVRACKKKESIDGLELKLESTQLNDKHKNKVANKNRNEDKIEGGNENKNGVKCIDRIEDHITVPVITKNKVKLNTTNNIIKNRFNPTITHDKLLISLNNNMKFTECSFHLKACSESMINLKALIEIDVLNLSLVVHEPEIWRR
jgi:hypothetical protein